MIDENKLIEELKSWDMQDEYLPVHFIDLIEEQPKFDLNDITEKATPKTAIIANRKIMYEKVYLCPNCKTATIEQHYKDNYCRRCGQALKYED